MASERCLVVGRGLLLAALAERSVVSCWSLVNAAVPLYVVVGVEEQGDGSGCVASPELGCRWTLSLLTEVGSIMVGNRLDLKDG